MHRIGAWARVGADQGVNSIASGSGRDQVANKTAGYSWHAASAAFQLFATVSTSCYFHDCLSWNGVVSSFSMPTNETSQLLHSDG